MYYVYKDNNEHFQEEKAHVGNYYFFITSNKQTYIINFTKIFYLQQTTQEDRIS